MCRTDLAIASGLPQLIRMPCPLSLCSLSRLCGLSDAENVRNDVPSAGVSALRLHLQRDLHMRLALSVWILRWVFTEPFEDDELIQLDLARAHVCTHRRQVLVDTLNDRLGRFSRQDLIQDVSVSSDEFGSGIQVESRSRHTGILFLTMHSILCASCQDP